MDEAPLIGEGQPLQTRALQTDAQIHIRHSGRWTDKLYSKKRAQLLETLDASEVRQLGEPQSALYDPPYMLPFMRRNEVGSRRKSAVN